MNTRWITYKRILASLSFRYKLVILYFNGSLIHAGFITLLISLLENIDSLSYAEFPKVDTLHYKYKKWHFLISPYCIRKFNECWEVWSHCFSNDGRGHSGGKACVVVWSWSRKVRQTSCVSMDMLLNLSFTHFPYLEKDGNENTYLQELL